MNLEQCMVLTRAGLVWETVYYMCVDRLLLPSVIENTNYNLILVTKHISPLLTSTNALLIRWLSDWSAMYTIMDFTMYAMVDSNMHRSDGVQCVSQQLVTMYKLFITMNNNMFCILFLVT